MTAQVTATTQAKSQEIQFLTRLGLNIANNLLHFFEHFLNLGHSARAVDEFTYFAGSALVTVSIHCIREAYAPIGMR